MQLNFGEIIDDGQLLGQCGLNVADFLSEAGQRDTADDLRVGTLEHGMIGLSDDELLTSVFKGHGFKPTSRDGEPLGTPW